jgi:uncharacterized membrane protein
MDQQGWGQPPQGDPQQQQQQQWGQPQGGQPAAPAGAPPGYFAQAAAQWPAPSDEDKQHAFFAHLFCALLNICCCGFLFPFLGALVPLAMTKSKHPFVMFHINQSLFFQASLYALNILLYIAGAIGNMCLIGWLLLPLNAIVVLLGAIYPILVGLKAKEGQWEKYAVIGDKVLAMQSPMFK